MSQRAMSINDNELNKMYARIAMVKAKIKPLQEK